MASSAPSNYYYYGVPSGTSNLESKMDTLFSTGVNFNQYTDQNRQYNDLMQSQADQTAQILAASQLDAQGVTYRDDLNTNAIKNAIERNGSLALDSIYKANMDGQKTGSAILSTTERVGSQLGSAVERVGSQIGSSVERVGSQVGSAVERTGAAAVHASEMSGAQLSNDIYRGNQNTLDTTYRATNELLGAIRSGIDATSNLGDRLYAGEVANRGYMGDHFNIIGEGLDRNLNASSEKFGNTNLLTSEKFAHTNEHLSGVKYHLSEDIWKAKCHLDKEIDRKHEWQMRELYHIDKHQHETREKIRRANVEQFAQTNLNLAKTENILAQQASNNFGKSQLDICKAESAIQLQAANNYANIQLEALKNKESLAAQMAECCCEIKQLVTGTAKETQDVVQAADNNRLRDALRTLETQNLLLAAQSGGGRHH